MQVGTHQRSIPHIQEARKFLQGGGLGLISQTNTFTYGNEAPQGMGPEERLPVPPEVDYNLWLGPAPYRVHFNSHRFHGKWRWFFDYASGMVGDWNVHLQDIVMWTMGATAPLAVSTAGGKFVLTDDRDTPDTMQAVYEFGPCALAPKGFTHTYTMRKASGKPWSRGGYGMDFHGTNGYAHVDRGIFKVEGDEVNWDDWQKKEKRIADLETKGDGGDQMGHANHVKNLLDCVRSRGTPIASIELHYNTVAACHLANVSLRVGRKVFWDADKALCYKDAEHKSLDREANTYLSREYRKGFELPNV